MSEAKLNQLEKRVNNLKEEKIRSEEKLKNLREQRDKIVSELTALGVSQESLGSTIGELTAKIEKELAAIDTQIPENIV